MTTLGVREAERYVLTRARDLRLASAGAASEEATEYGVERAEQGVGGPLSTEQREAVDVLTGAAPVAALTGPAGTGKGAVIRAASEAFQADGRQVIAVATQGATAQRLGGQAAATAFTIDGLAARERHERITLDPGTVIFVDEAGTVDTDRFATLFEIAHSHHCQLRFVGDAEQLQAIGAGGLFEHICEIVPTAELVELHRAREQWMRDAQLAIRDGRSQDALTILAEHDAAHMLNTHADAMQRMVDDWGAWRGDYESGDTLMVVHTTNRDVDTVNTLAQAKRLEAGELGAESVKAPDRSYELHVSDRVMFRAAPYKLDEPRAARVENGTRGTITEVDAARNTVMVALDESGRDPRAVRVDLGRCPALRLDYASHVYPAQGDTRSRTAELTGGVGTSREAAYVGGSRLRDRHDLYTSRQALGTDGTDLDRWTRLAEQMNTSHRQLPSVNYEQTERRIATMIPRPVERAAHLTLPDVERELAQAVRSRDELAHTRPVQIERDIARLGRDVGESVDRYHWLDRQIKRYERDLEQAKPWQRREIRELRVQIDDFAKQQERITRDVEERSNRAHALQHGPDGPDAWQRAHAGDLAARTQQVDELTVQRDELRQREVERVLRQPPEYLTRVIGAEPAEPDKAHPWREAARTIEEYRLVNHVTDKKSALGREPEGSHRQLLEFEKAKRQALAARETLGLSRKAHEVTREAMPLSLGIERGHGRGQERGIGR